MKYYCIGIKGAGMSTLANILSDLGNDVSGYDDTVKYKFTEEGLDKRGIKIYHEPHPIDSDTIVTYSKAFSIDHPEIKRVRELGLTMRDYNQVVGDVTAMFETIGISGTHGKTTTSLLISDILKNTVGCNYFVGDGTGYADKKNKLFVIESDEFNKHFLAYHPTIAVITNIELDHTECYPGGLEEIKDTFKKFGNKAEQVVACGDDSNIRNIKFDKDVIYYGFNDNNNVVAKNVKLTDKGSEFDVYINNELFDSYELPLFGKHMILNALASIIIANRYNINKEDIKGNVDINFFGYENIDFDIGANKYGYAVFKNPKKAFKTLKKEYSDGIKIIQKEFKLPPLNNFTYKSYKTYGWQVTTGTPSLKKEAKFVTLFLDIYENSFN